MDLDLAGICDFLFDLLRNVAGKKDHLVLVYLFRLDHYTDLPACLNSIGGGDPGEAVGDFFELFETFYIGLDILASRARTGS